MNYSILVKSIPYSCQAAQSAYLFAQALIAKQHQIHQVFFYQDAVYTANALSILAPDELNLVQAWINLAQHHNIPLLVCATMAAKRGMLGPNDADYYGLSVTTIQAPFTTVGLGQLLEAMTQADRFIVF